MPAPPARSTAPPTAALPAVKATTPPAAPPPPARPAAPPAMPTSVAVRPAAPAPVAAAPATAGPDAAKLEAFLVNFVVEQTGYPAEIVDLDADLEGDLGIDSIKKAQLFGELREYFDVTPRADMSLDDFPTLRHVRDFLMEADPAGASKAALPDVTPAPAPVVAVAKAPPAPPAVAPAPARPAPVAAAPAKPAPAVAVGPSGPSLKDPGTLEAFLVNFVVEQTGYPAEIVDLDADLEGDLGIDSIKKAQLFGELREYFDVTPRADMSLDDFPTLRHVQDFLLEGAAA